MRPTIAFLQQKFDEYNRLVFGGGLPRVPILLGNAKGYLGQCLSTRERRPGGRIVHTNFRLRFSTRHDLPQQEWEDTVIHEMIHLYIGVRGLQDRSSHGPIFRKMMDSINQRFGRHLTISHRAPVPRNAVPSTNRRPRYHAVAIVRMADGRVGLKVLPRIEQRILAYYQGATRAIGVASVSLYMVCDPYFEQFPNSSVLRVHFVKAEEVLPHLGNAEVLHTDGRRILY